MTSVKRLYVFCEGQTEETFAELVLRPHFLNRSDTDVRPLLLRNRPGFSTRRHEGGWVSYAEARKFVVSAMRQHHSEKTWFTTLLDCYGLPDDFPGGGSPHAASARERVERREQAFKDDIATDELWRFTPHLQLHEFEALLLAGPEEIAEAFPHRAAGVADLIAGLGGSAPEDVDDGPGYIAVEAARPLHSGVRGPEGVGRAIDRERDRARAPAGAMPAFRLLDNRDRTADRALTEADA